MTLATQCCPFLSRALSQTDATAASEPALAAVSRCPFHRLFASDAAAPSACPFSGAKTVDPSVLLKSARTETVTDVPVEDNTAPADSQGTQVQRHP